MKKLSYSIEIQAPRAAVWDVLTGDETYRQWTKPFCDGTYYEGNWEQGSKMRFLATNGDGMVAEIAENRLHEYISIRHLGEVKQGVEDTTSEAVQAWAPAHENYIFADTEGGTKVTAEAETLDEYEPFLDETFPKALAALKDICETK